VPTPSGVARAGNGNWHVASVLNGASARFTAPGRFFRDCPTPGSTGGPPSTGNPQGIAVDSDGDLYFADLQLTSGPGGIGPGPNGKVRWIHFDENGTPSPPKITRERLAFPDALGILPGSLPPCSENCPPACPGDCNGSTMVTIDELRSEERRVGK